MVYSVGNGQVALPKQGEEGREVPPSRKKRVWQNKASQRHTAVVDKYIVGSKLTALW